ncbi:MAG TPA: HNH endonuclease, partial [Pirellulaceae bacterium]|nr:HNH endonuclease [Pirellulaceae bacterium]
MTISNDPIGFSAGDANLYRYVGNESTNATDPSGLAKIKWYKIFGGHSVGVDGDTLEFVLKNGRRVKIRNAKFIDCEVTVDDLAELTSVKKSTLDKLRNKEKYPDGVVVKYDKLGQPDYTNYERANVKIDKPDASNYQSQSWAELQRSDPEAYLKWYRYRNHLRWHHKLNGEMQLIPTDVHEAFQHTGLQSLLAKLKESAPAVATTAAVCLIPGAAYATEGDYNGAARDVAWSSVPLTWISDIVAGMFSGLYDMGHEVYD